VGYRTYFVYQETAGRDQRSLERWLCYFLRPLLPREVAWRFLEAPAELWVVLDWGDPEAFAAWYHSEQCRAFRDAHGSRPRPRLRAPRWLETHSMAQVPGVLHPLT
jgi:hypothetical protein